MRGKRWYFGLALLALGLVATAQLSYGAGFGLYEGSARGNALGGAFVGKADDPSALFYNPAGITQLDGLQVMTGATVILPSTDVVINGQSHSSEDNVWIPPHFYATYRFSERVWFGLATFSQFGLGTEFDENWPGRYNSYNAVIQTATLNPNIAVKLNDQLSLAAGLEIMWFDLTLEQKIDPLNLRNPVSDVDQSLKGDSFGYGFNVAMHYKPCNWVSMGISYRSQVKQHLKGEADFSVPDAVGNILPGYFNDTDVEGAVTLPDMLFLGLTFYPMDRLSFEVGGIFNRWSTYDALTIGYENSPNPNLGSPLNVTRQKKWENAWRLMVGAEYKATDWLDLRFGYDFDEEPIDDQFVDYLVPANDRHMFSFGPGIHWNNWTFDLSYTYIYITERNVDESESAGVIVPSKFENGEAHLFGVSVSYMF